MRTRFVITVLGVSLLAGCAMHSRDHAAAQGVHRGAALNQQPMVTVKGGIVSVGPEPLVFLKDEREQRITWRLPRGLSFADRGIVIEGRLLDPATGQPLRPGQDALKNDRVPIDPGQQEIVDCKPAADRQSYSCLNRNTRPGVFRYTIRVLADGKLLVWDPAIMNME